MRAKGLPSEIGALARPLVRLVDGAWLRMHWWISAMAILYILSGITVVKSDEVAVILRWGSLVGSTPAQQAHGPGLLFAFPKPIDQVVHVPVKQVREVTIDTLAPNQGSVEDEDEAPPPVGTLDPLTQGYAVTGDHNIVHVMTVAHFRVKDPGEWAFYAPASFDVLRVEVTAAMVRSLGEMGVDRVLSDGRKDLIALVTRRAQAGLDAAHAGLELSSLELIRLIPPLELATDFDAVQSAFIGAETRRKEAQGFAESVVPRAQAETDSALQTARGDALADLARAKGEAARFIAVAREYRANPEVTRERLYRDTLEKAIGNAGNIRWIPPPSGSRYQGLQLTVGSPDSGFAPPRQFGRPSRPSGDPD